VKAIKLSNCFAEIK